MDGGSFSEISTLRGARRDDPYGQEEFNAMKS
jgi:hypothetical protein